LLNELMGLVELANTASGRDALADALDMFADSSDADDLATITRLDASARKTARALRNQNDAESIAQLAAASAGFRDTVKDFTVSTLSLKQEASMQRAEKLTAASASLTDTIASLKNLAQIVSNGKDAELLMAMDEAVASAQKLRGLLERSA
jgi:hypothetical protein